MYGYGTVFKVTSGGTSKVLHNFTCGSDGCVPVAGLVQGTDGSFYGTAREGGANSNGTVFKITPTGTLTTLHAFAGVDGAAPFGGLVLATDGNFYGTASGGGTLTMGRFFESARQVITRSVITSTAALDRHPTSAWSSIRMECCTETLCKVVLAM